MTDLNSTPTAPTSNPSKNRLIRIFFLVLAVLFLVLGLIGVFLPAMPTTVFILLSAWCGAKSSERFHNWLLNHKIFGKMVRDWHEKKAMPRKAKYLAWSMMGLSCLFLFYHMPDRLLWVVILTTVICFATSIWMARLPDS